MKRREFIAGLGSAVAWPVVASAQDSMPVVAFVDPGDSNGDASLVAAFRKGLNETGFIDGTNVTIEIYWLEGKFDRVSVLTAELVGRQVAAIASTTPGALAAKAATSTIPIVFASGGDPVKLGLVTSLNRPGGNVTGVSFFGALMESKRLGLLHEMVPQAGVVAVLLNSSNPVIDTQSREVGDAAHALGVRIDVHRASTDRDIDTAFATIGKAQAGALLIASDPFFNSMREKLAAEAARHMLMYYFLEDYDAALRTADKVIRLRLDRFQAYRTRAAALGQLGRIEEAKDALNQAAQFIGFTAWVRTRHPGWRQKEYAHVLEGLRKAASPSEVLLTHHVYCTTAALRSLSERSGN
jgi:putative tryptophan/tyrosine transport system substrate-binding protein